jgi:hypothetical protein
MVMYEVPLVVLDGITPNVLIEKITIFILEGKMVESDLVIILMVLEVTYEDWD